MAKSPTRRGVESGSVSTRRIFATVAPRSESATMREARLRRTMPAQSPANAAISHATETEPVFSSGRKTWPKLRASPVKKRKTTTRAATQRKSTLRRRATSAAATGSVQSRTSLSANSAKYAPPEREWSSKTERSQYARGA